MGKLEKAIQLAKELELAESKVKQLRTEMEEIMGIKTVCRVSASPKFRKRDNNGNIIKPWMYKRSYYNRKKISDRMKAYWATKTPEERSALIRKGRAKTGANNGS